MASDLEKENTMRALADKPLIAPRRCNWGLHRWSRWALHDSNSIAEVYVRHCVDCNWPDYGRKAKRSVY